jgi:hypothetical protein
MKIPQMLVVLGIAGVAALAIVMFERRHQDHALAELRQEVTALAAADDHGGIRGPTPANDKVAAYLAMAAVATASGRDAGGTTPAAKKEVTPERQAAETHERLEAAYAQDPPDAAWAARARAIADRRLPGLLPEGSVMRSFECHSAICRLETGHKDFDSYMKFIHNAFLNSSEAMWNGATYSTPVHDDPSEGLIVTYIAREGHELPRMAE